MNLFDQIQTLDFPAELPETLLLVEQTFHAPQVQDVAAATRLALETSGLLAAMTAGQSVAVGVGSRGITNLPAIVLAVVDRLRQAGLHPFLFPAMGSHGGATAEGQREILAGLGVTEESMGVEIRATMEVREIGRIPDGPPLYQGVESSAADHVLLVSRIKPHTDFRSHLESGPSKMAVIGLGKQFGAALMHAGGGANFQRYLAPAARIYATRTNLRGAIAIVENAYDQTAHLFGLTADQIGRDPEAILLETAKSLLPGLPFPEIDVMVVRQIGKPISGTGMDTNVIGRLMIPRQPETFGGPDVAVLVVLDMMAESHGNASGLGLANLTTARAVGKIDWTATYTNAITSGIFGMWRAAMPITLADDRRALEAALRCCARPPQEARFVFFQDTLTLGRLWVSPNLRAQVEAHPRLRVIDEIPLRFGPDGGMISPWLFEEAGPKSTK